MNKYSNCGRQKLTSPNRKKVLLMISLSLFMVAIISIGTYAIWSSELLTGNNSITTGQVKMSYTESNEIGMDNALPIKDEEGKLLTNYFDFQVLSYIKTRANDSTQRKLNYNIILEPITVDNPLSDSEIKLYLTKVENGTETVVVEPTTIDQLNNKILKSQEEIFSNNKGEVITSYRLRSWIDSKVDPTKFNEKKYSYKFRVNINNNSNNSTEPVEPMEEHVVTVRTGYSTTQDISVYGRKIQSTTLSDNSSCKFTRTNDDSSVTEYDQCLGHYKITKPTRIIYNFYTLNEEQKAGVPLPMALSIDYDITTTSNPQGELNWISQNKPDFGKTPGDFELIDTTITQEDIDNAGGIYTLHLMVRGRMYSDKSIEEIGQVYHYAYYAFETE